MDEKADDHLHDFVGEGVGMLDGMRVCNLAMMQHTVDLGPDAGDEV